MASKEGDDAFASVAATFFAQVRYVVMVLLVLFFRVTLIDVLTVFLLTMLAGVAVQFSVAIKLQRKGTF
jgi:hypothetical protein